MNRLTLALTHAIWKLLPSRRLRTFLFNSYVNRVRHRRMVAEIDGIRFDLDLSEMIDLTMYLRRFEPAVVAAISRYCRPGWTVLDIGANIGAHCLRLAKRVGPGGVVHAFEPTDFAFAKLKRNLSLNTLTNVHLHKIALSDQALPAQEVQFRSSWQMDGTSVSGSSVVEFVRLDDWCHTQKVDRVHLIKLDTDGYEFKILQGGRELITRCKPLLFLEVVDDHFQSDQTNPLVFLKDLGYRFYAMSTGKEYPGIEGVRRVIPRPGQVLRSAISELIAAPGELTC